MHILLLVTLNAGKILLTVNSPVLYLYLYIDIINLLVFMVELSWFLISFALLSNLKTSNIP